MNMNEEPLNDIFQTSYKSQNRNQSVHYTFAAKVILDGLCKEVVGETLGVHIENTSGFDSVVQMLSKKELTLSSFMELTASFVMCKENNANDENK